MIKGRCQDIESHLWNDTSFHIPTLNAWNLYLETPIHILNIATSQQKKKRNYLDKFQIACWRNFAFNADSRKAAVSLQLLTFFVVQAQLQKKTQPSLSVIKIFDCHHWNVPAFSYSNIKTQAASIYMFFFMTAKFCTVCIKTVCIHGSSQASSSWVVHVSDYQQRWRADFPQKCTGH